MRDKRPDKEGDDWDNFNREDEGELDFEEGVVTMKKKIKMIQKKLIYVENRHYTNNNNDNNYGLH
jgi:hypothetical protein